MHSQFNDEIIIQSHFPLNYIGNCIEVGLGYGDRGSTTLFFEKKGWKCIGIEANPMLADYSRQYRKNVVNCAVGSENLPSIPFHILQLDWGNESAVSSLKIDERLYEQHKDMIQSTRTIDIELKTLDRIIEDANLFNSIDFISIDTEGTELDVLKGFDLNKWQPKLLMIENNYSDIEVEEYLKQFGYTKSLRHEVNDFYIL